MADSRGWARELKTSLGYLAIAEYIKVLKYIKINKYSWVYTYTNKWLNK